MTNAPHISRNVAKGQDVPFGSLESILIVDGLKDALLESQWAIQGRR